MSDGIFKKNFEMSCLDGRSFFAWWEVMRVVHEEAANILVNV